MNELRELAESMCAGTITADEIQRLEAMLRNNPAAQTVYLAYLDMHAQFVWERRRPVERPVQPLKQPKQWAIALAASVFVVVGAFLWFSSQIDSNRPENDMTTEPVSNKISKYPHPE